MDKLTVHFTENAHEEITQLMTDLRLLEFAEQLKLIGTSTLPEEMQNTLVQLISAATDLFSDSLPDLPSDPNQALRVISRDINLARILRERGIFRMWMFTESTDENGLPIYMSLENPVTGGPFATQEELIGWFCGEAKVSRSLIFLRLAAISRLISLGFSKEEAFNTIISKPYAIREALNSMADWNKGELTDVDPVSVVRLAERLDPDRVDQAKELAELVMGAGDEEDRKALQEFAKPLMAKMIREVAESDNAKDALDWVKHDLLLQPDIRYAMEEDTDILFVELLTTRIDPETGEVTMGHPVSVPFVPDATEIPREIIEDLKKRLPIRTKAGGSNPF